MQGLIISEYRQNMCVSLPGLQPLQLIQFLQTCYSEKRIPLLCEVLSILLTVNSKEDITDGSISTNEICKDNYTDIIMNIHLVISIV